MNTMIYELSGGKSDGAMVDLGYQLLLASVPAGRDDYEITAFEFDGGKWFSNLWLDGQLLARVEVSCLAGAES